ncbi:toxin Doc [Streptomyces nojiriensis]|uniref:toxin Doc n=1 Tax=Streptomyces nojiriensis TaxID=66374 RepID=UPI00367BAB6A
MELHIDIRWLLDRQEELLGKDLGVQDHSGLVAAVTRHRVNTVVLVRPPPARNEYFGYGVAGAYLRASGKAVDDAFEAWHALITDIRALRLNVYDVADRLRSLRPTS